MMLALASAAVGLSSCGGGSGSDDTGDQDAARKLAAAEVPEALTVTSEAFEPGGEIPVELTCDGDETSLPLAWEGVPPETAELAVVFDDPDAEDYVHWVLFGLDRTVTELGAGEVPDGARQAENSYGDPKYMGSCPKPEDDPHEYRITVYALGEELDAEDGSPAEPVLQAIEESAIGKGTLRASFDR